MEFQPFDVHIMYHNMYELAQFTDIGSMGALGAGTPMKFLTQWNTTLLRFL